MGANVSRTDDSQNPKTWGCQVPPLIPIDPTSAYAYNAVTLVNPHMHPNHVFFVDQWHLARKDSGAISFDASAPAGGLVVYLTDQPIDKTLSEARGFAVVLDNQGRVPETYIAKVPGQPAKHSKTRVNRGFQMVPGVAQKYWIIYEAGNLLVGQGSNPGDPEAKIITCLENDGTAPSNMYYFGFGTLRKEERGIEVNNIRTFDAPAANCEWKALIPARCSDLEANSADTQ